MGVGILENGAEPGHWHLQDAEWQRIIFEVAKFLEGSQGSVSWALLENEQSHHLNPQFNLNHFEQEN